MRAGRPSSTSRRSCPPKRRSDGKTPLCPFSGLPNLAKPLPPRSWASEWLTITPGRPTVFAGEGGTRKGWFAMALMVGGAAGVPILGHTLKESLRSLYLDWEQGEIETRGRFQALARGYDIDLAALGTRLGYRWRPVPSLADNRNQHTLDVLCRHADGMDLVVIDSNRAASPGVDENSVQASGVGDVCLAASEKTGASFVILDHAGKPKNDEPSGRTRKHSQRGHSSKLDISQAMFVFSCKKGEPTLVTCERSQVVAQEAWPVDFLFTLAPSVHGGLCLQSVTAAPVPVVPSGDEAFERDADRLLESLRKHGGQVNQGELAKRLSRRKGEVAALLEYLVREERIVNVGTKQKPDWKINAPTDAPHEDKS